MQGRKVRNKDDAASPVVGTIMMAAVAVVLAAPVYSWAGGIRAERDQPAAALSMSSDSAIVGGVKTFSIASATPGLRWTDVAFTLDGIELAYDGALGNDGEYCIASPGSTCAAGAAPPDRPIGAGDTVRVQHAALAGMTLRILDREANAVMLTTSVL